MDCPSQKNNVSKEQLTSQKKALWIFKSQGLLGVKKIINTNFILKKLNAAL